MKKETGELLDMLKRSSDLSEYMNAVSDDMIEKISLSECLNLILEKKGLKKSRVIYDSGLDRGYGYDIFSGAKMPARDKVLALGFAMRLTCDEMQELLKKTGYPILYPRYERDNVILYGFTHSLPLGEVNELLYEMGHLIIE